MFGWDDVRFAFIAAVLLFVVPFALFSGIITANYVFCDKMNVCDSVEVQK